jgi:hypothetical protein
VRVLARSLAGDDADPTEQGLFAGEHTFERDVYAADAENATRMLAALAAFRWGTERSAELQEALAGSGLSGERLMVFVNAATKGRFAQRLAREADSLVPPPYVAAALDHLVDA